MGAPIFLNQTIILAKVEATKGQDAAPTAAANAMLVSKVTFTPLEGDEVQREVLRGYFGHAGSALVNQYCKLSFSIEGAGVLEPGAMPGYAPLLRACGASATETAGEKVVFVPVTPAVDTVTLYVQIGGNLQKVTSGMANCKFFADAKTLPRFDFEFWGTYAATTQAVVPTAVYTAFQEPLGVNKVNTTLELHGAHPAVHSFSLDFGNSVVKRDAINLDTVELIERKSTASVTFDNTLVSEKNWVELARLATRGTLAFKHGQGAHNVIELAAPAAQLGKPSFGESDGVQTITVPMPLCPVVGNDEWLLTVR